MTSKGILNTDDNQKLVAKKATSLTSKPSLPSISNPAPPTLPN